MPHDRASRAGFPSIADGSSCWPFWVWQRSASIIFNGCPSTPFPTSPTCRCRSTPKRRGTRRWKPSSGSRFRSKPPSRVCPIFRTRARCRATDCRKSPSSSRTAPTSTSPASSSTSVCSRRADSSPKASTPSWARSPPGSAKSSCTPSSPTMSGRDRMEKHGRQRTCAQSRIGSSVRSCARCLVSPRSTPSAATSSNSTSHRCLESSPATIWVSVTLRGLWPRTTRASALAMWSGVVSNI